MRTPVARIMQDDRARAVLESLLPDAALTDPGLAQMVACLPYAPFQRAWGLVAAVHLSDRDPKEVAALRHRVEAELAAVQVD